MTCKTTFGSRSATLTLRVVCASVVLLRVCSPEDDANYRMELLQSLLDVRALIQWGGIVGITTIVFVETGLFFGFFLPGDSLLVTAGILAAAGVLDIAWLLVCPTIAAIAGDQTGYAIGRTGGSALALRYPKFT